MVKRRMIWALAAILVAGVLPVLTLYAFLFFATVFGCGFDDDQVRSCVVLGFDFGNVLLVIGIVALWSVWILAPLASLALVVWLVVLAVLLLVGWRRRAGTRRVNEQRVSA
jgi:hypothetical protein